MLPTYKKLEENFAKAWSMVTPPFEQVEIPYEGHKLPALFWLGRGKPGTKLPVVYNYGGADGILLRGEDGGAGQYTTARHALHRRRRPWPRRHVCVITNSTRQPDSDRIAKAVIDYLVARADVDAESYRLAWFKSRRLFRPALRHR